MQTGEDNRFNKLVEGFGFSYPSPFLCLLYRIGKPNFFKPRLPAGREAIFSIPLSCIPQTASHFVN